MRPAILSRYRRARASPPPPASAVFAEVCSAALAALLMPADALPLLLRSLLGDGLPRLLVEGRDGELRGWTAVSSQSSASWGSAAFTRSAARCPISRATEAASEPAAAWLLCCDCRRRSVPPAALSVRPALVHRVGAETGGVGGEGGLVRGLAAQQSATRCRDVGGSAYKGYIWPRLGQIRQLVGSLGLCMLQIVICEVDLTLHFCHCYCGFWQLAASRSHDMHGQH